jgi:hypothetical protein
MVKDRVQWASDVPISSLSFAFAVSVVLSFMSRNK